MFCRQCGREIANEAVICPHCGVPTGFARTNPDGKTRAAYVLLGLFLGGFGAHNWYAGYNGKAAAQVIITLVSWVVLIAGAMKLIGSISSGEPLEGAISLVVLPLLALLAVGIWVLIEVLSVRKDAKGHELM